MGRNQLLVASLLAACGCGSYTAAPGGAQRNVTLSEMVVTPNFASNSISVKSIHLEDGTSRLVTNAFPSGGTHPVIARAHPNVLVFYVVNRDSNVISQFSLDSAGGVSMISTIACPSNTQLFVIHPSGGWAYAAGGNLLRSYTVSSTGILSVLGTDVILANTAGWDADFSRSGAVLHIPEVGQIQSFPVSNGGVLGVPSSTALASAADAAVDLDVRPGGTSMEVVVQGTNSVRSYALNANGLPGALTVQDLNFQPTTGDFSGSGQYYLGENSSPSVHVYESSPVSGALSELPGSPLTLTGVGGAFFVALDLTENFVFSTDANSNNRLDVRLRQANGQLEGSSVDSQGLSVPGKFDFFLFQTP